MSWLICIRLVGVPVCLSLIIWMPMVSLLSERMALSVHLHLWADFKFMIRCCLFTWRHYIFLYSGYHMSVHDLLYSLYELRNIEDMLNWTSYPFCTTGLINSTKQEHKLMLYSSHHMTVKFWKSFWNRVFVVKTSIYCHIYVCVVIMVVMSWCYQNMQFPSGLPIWKFINTWRQRRDAIMLLTRKKKAQPRIIVCMIFFRKSRSVCICWQKDFGLRDLPDLVELIPLGSRWVEPDKLAFERNKEFPCCLQFFISRPYNI